MRRAVVRERHVPTYPAPIVVRAGDRGVLVRRDDEDGPDWVWVEHRETGRGGWTPSSILDPAGEPRTVVFRRDYDARELDVEAGEIVQAGEPIGDWVWCEAANGEAGWLPSPNLAPETDPG